METTRIMMIDTETTNDVDCPICYDVGFEIFDLTGHTYAIGSFVNADVFLDTELMDSAFFKDKIPQYWNEIHIGCRELRSWKYITRKLYEIVQKYNVEIICAHNARFDYRSLHLTQRYITTSKWRWIFPFGQAEWWDTLKMAREFFKDDDNYTQFCVDNDYLTFYGKPRFTAEIIYQYLTHDTNFTESHTGLEDVKIERKIFEYLIKNSPELDGRLWKPKDEPVK